MKNKCKSKRSHLFLVLLMGLQHYACMIEDIYFTRENKNKEASAEEVRKFENSAISDFGRGNRVFLIEKFPKKFYQFATKIKLEKALEPAAALSALSNSMLFKVVSTNKY